MCGIAGIYNLNGGQAGPERVRRMTDAIAHRGPDDSGFLSDCTFAMGMRRLSIIDLDTGHQPIFNEAGDIAVVFNGEIYNYRELIPGLESRGHKIKTKSDTEVIVHLYEDFGAEFVHKLNGMFAIAVWDSRERKLLLARDRLGVKPLYWTESGGELLFGSEMKCLLAAGCRTGGVDAQALDYYLSVQYFPIERTIYNNIKKLPAGHIMEARPGGTTISKYWDVRFPGKKTGASEQESVERFLELFRESVKLRLVSDVPLGAFLSGGIDSGAVASVMSGMMNEPVKSFSIGFGAEAPDYDELDAVDVTARSCGAEVHKWVVTGKDVLDRLDRAMDHFDEPFGGGIHTLLVSEIAKKEVTVALTGIGSDELLGGYERQKKARLVRHYKKLPGAVRAAARFGASAASALPAARGFADKLSKIDRLAAASAREIYFEWISVFDRAAKEKFYTPGFISDSSGEPLHEYIFRTLGDSVPTDFDDMISYLELKTTLPDDFLNYTDKTSMAWSLEARTPFLDYNLVEFAAALPMDMKVRNGTTKYILKKAMSGLLPDEIIYRKKQPFFLPLGIWFRGALRPLVEDCIMKKDPAFGEFIRPEAAREVALEHLSGRADHAWLLWSLIVLERWRRKFL